MRVDQRFAVWGGIFTALFLTHSRGARADVGNPLGSDEASVSVENTNLLEEDEPADASEGPDASEDREQEQEAGVAGAVPGTSVSGSGVVDNGSGLAGRFSANYLAVFYGPPLSGGSAYQPTPSGASDPNRPVQLRNFANVGYNISDKMAVTGTFYWLWEAPNQRGFSIQDPQLRVSHDRIVADDSFDLYADVRLHLPLSASSHAADVRGGVQLFQGMSWMVPNTSLQANLYTSQRYNFFGRQGAGNDLELYIAPNLTWGFSRAFSLSLTVEAGASHVFGGRFGTLEGNGVDIEPGFFWEPVTNLLLNPYLTFYPNAQISPRTTSFGMTMSWTLL